MNITIEQAKEVIKSLKDEDKTLETFTSHKFIGTYIKLYESEYLDLLVDEKNNPKNTEGIFKPVHRKIGQFLSNNQKKLCISYIRDIPDMNIHYRKTSCAEWRFESFK